jgi:hypothetical protein
MPTVCIPLLKCHRPKQQTCMMSYNVVEKFRNHLKNLSHFSLLLHCLFCINKINTNRWWWCEWARGKRFEWANRKQLSRYSRDEEKKKKNFHCYPAWVKKACVIKVIVIAAVLAMNFFYACTFRIYINFSHRNRQRKKKSPFNLIRLAFYYYTIM